jgi:hemolysin D
VLAPKWPNQDEEFWPSAREVLETPVSPIRVAMMCAICALFSILAAAAWLLSIDIHAVAHGRIQSVGRSKIVQSLDAGQIISIDVQEGAHVRAGDILLRLDPTEVMASRDEYARQRDEYAAEIARRRVAIDVAQHGDDLPVPKIPFPVGTVATLQAREELALAAGLLQLRSKLTSLDSKIAESAAQKQSLQQTMSAQAELLKTLQERLDMREELRHKTWETAASVMDAKETLYRETTSMVEHTGQWAQADAAIASIVREKAEEKAKFINDNTEAMAASEAKMDDAEQELIKASAKAGRASIPAPIDGVVQELAVTTMGQVVTSGQQLMTVVPTDEPIEVEALVSNVDIGFVRVGQAAAIKIDTFPFGIYGTIPGSVSRVSRDAVDARDAREALPTAAAAATPTEAAGAAATSTPQTQNLVFPVTVLLDRTAMVVDGTSIALSPGMTCEIEIVTGKRRVIDYLLSPLRETSSQAIHER